MRAGLVRAAEPAGEAADPAALNTTAAVAAPAVARPDHAPDYLEQGVDLVLAAFDLRSSGNSVTHYSISLFLVVIAPLARRLATRLLCPPLRLRPPRTRTTPHYQRFHATHRAAPRPLSLASTVRVPRGRAPDAVDGRLPALRGLCHHDARDVLEDGGERLAEGHKVKEPLRHARLAALACTLGPAIATLS